MIKMLIYAIVTSFAVFILSCKPEIGSQILVDTLIINITAIDAKNGVRENCNVAILNDQVIDVFTSDSKQNVTAEKTIDGDGKFLIPGLWDAHVHMIYDTLLSVKMFDLFLAYGVTNIRDTGGQIIPQKAWRTKSQLNPYTTPGLYISGPLVDGDPIVYGDDDPTRPHLGVGSSNPQRIVEIAKELIEHDVDFLKAYEMLSSESFDSLVLQAQKANLKVTGHIPLSMDAIRAVENGLNSIEHLRNIEMACSSEWESLLIQRQKLLLNNDKQSGGVLRSRIHNAQRGRAIETQSEERTNEVIAAFKNNDTWQTPTLSIMTAAAFRPWATTEYQKTFDFLPDTVGQRWKKGSMEYVKTPIDTARITYANWMMSMVDKMNKNNINIMAGTDCPIFFLTPGYSLHGELELLVKSGMSIMDVLAAATLKPAEYFGLENQMGTIDKGMIADLVILDANPLTNISNTQEINTVFKNGNMMNRNALDEILNRK